MNQNCPLDLMQLAQGVFVKVGAEASKGTPELRGESVLALRESISSVAGGPVPAEAPLDEVVRRGITTENSLLKIQLK